MKQIRDIDLDDVQAVYSGPEGELWELVMGEQIHIGGLSSSQDLAEKGEIQPGSHGVDLCCCNGAGMRFLVRLRGVARMIGVDATRAVVEKGKRRSMDQGLGDRINFVLADACNTGLRGGEADFVWGEDAWCYVIDKPGLIAEAVRLVKPDGIIAFTDWVEGPSLTDSEAERFLRFMKFPSLATLDDYAALLSRAGCRVCRAENTGRFAPYATLYMEMLQRQLTYDALRILGFDAAVLEAMSAEMSFLCDLADEGKIAQGLLVAQKRG